MRPLIKQSYTVNIAIGTNVSSINVPLQVPFKADGVILRNFSYGTGIPTPTVGQIGTNLVANGVLLTFGDVSITSQMDVFFPLPNSFSQQNTWNFNVQILPTSGTGPGTILDPVAQAGQIAFMLEFVQY